jgi:hypothetical protein
VREHAGSVNSSLISFEVVLAAPPLPSGDVAFADGLNAPRRKLISVAEGGQQSNDDRNKANSGHERPRSGFFAGDSAATSMLNRLMLPLVIRFPRAARPVHILLTVVIRIRLVAIGPSLGCTCAIRFECGKDHNCQIRFHDNVPPMLFSHSRRLRRSIRECSARVDPAHHSNGNHVAAPEVCKYSMISYHHPGD